MPVSTRSQIFHHEQNQEEQNLNPIRNPHHGLKEKMRALTLLYEQQKRASLALKNQPFSSSNPNEKEQEEDEGDLEQRFTTHPSVDLLGSCQNEEKKKKKRKEPTANSGAKKVMTETNSVLFPNSMVTRTYILPHPPIHDEAKENLATDGDDRILSFATAGPRKAAVTRQASAVARKLSLGNLDKKCNFSNVHELEGVLGKSSGVGESRILVFVRLRPMAKKEKEAGSRCCVRIVNRRDVYLTEFANDNDYLRLKRLRGRHFTFDASFPDTTSQQEVYSTTTAELVEAVLQGRNGSVFCYGATGAGKTYTMLGTLENPGVMALAIKDLFSKVRQRSCDGNHVVHLSYLEVYNETVRDLLSPGRPLVLREDKQGIVAAGLTQYRAYSTDEVMALLQQGNRNRTTEPTRANETSSRSHAILQVVVQYRVRDDTMNVVNRVGKLSLIDLAGSERALATDQRSLRSLEGANINRSLLALSSFINALVEGKKHITVTRP